MEEIWRAALGAAQVDELAVDQVGAWSDAGGAPGGGRSEAGGRSPGG
jgi:hypothetical protein